MLKQHGEFHPFAGAIDQAGDFALVGGDYPAAQDDPLALVQLFKETFRTQAAAGEIQAAAICFNVGARLPGYATGGDAICCDVEIDNAKPMQIFVPYRKGWFGSLKYDAQLQLQSEPFIFPPASD